ncbi:MAG: hypothetical protein IE936_09185 [Moraxella osloensis]|nr:hypothetical protein [Moraxella osloensis]
MSMIKIKLDDREVLDYLHRLQQCIGDVTCVLSVEVDSVRQMLDLQSM